MKWHFTGGTGRKVEITYAEDLTEAHDALRAGLTDSIILAESETVYEPFWYRTFRYVVVKVSAGTSAVTLMNPQFRKTGFPLEVKTTIHSSSSWVNEVWDLCVRTLENCMMDTYMDCPFYEQMQYPMDTRLQASFTYAVSGDARLPKKALYDFHRAMTPTGLIPGKAPTGYMQVISTFSLHYILMLFDYYQQTGETDILYELRSDVDGMLEYYAAHIRKEDGLMGHPGYWAFVDWQDAWEENGGEPTALKEGGSALISLLYGYTLLCAARIMEATERPAIAEEYRIRQKAIAAAVNASCWDSDRQLYREGPNHIQFSQHTQSWAVLNGLKKGSEAAELLQRTVDCENVLKCSFSTSNEFFRACQTADAYELTDAAMEQWRQLPQKGLTTCPETPHNARSLCHAWSALPIYEMVHAMAGIESSKPGWEEIVIHPHLIGVKDLSGEAVTPVGMIGFNYKKSDTDALECELQIPEGTECFIQHRDGHRSKLSAGKNMFVLY
ncbi:MAG: alpha-L-rhamnosidase C-terminal domain-containing protein [Eubacteriales bacterium]|nr:alpha-L-rhamnosidase C-terminal domain-containing protein [Eubacteriales bacterium]